MVKKAILGLVWASMCSALAVMPASAHGGTSSVHDSHHVFGVPVICGNRADSLFLSSGGFVRYLNRLGHFTFQVGRTSRACYDLGIRLDADGLPPNSFSLDWDLTNPEDPFIVIFVLDASGNRVCWTDWDIGGVTPPPGFSSRLLPNGLTRITYSGRAGGIPSNYRWSDIFLYNGDFEGCDAFQTTFSNVAVDGLSVVPDLSAPINPPIIDCSDCHPPE